MSNELQKHEGNNKIVKSAKKKLDLASINSNALSKSLGGITLPRLFYQLVVFVVDGSRSMISQSISGNSKGEEVDKAIYEVLHRLRQSKNSNSFDICYYVFSDVFQNLFGIKNLHDINTDQKFNPIDIIETPSGTHLADCLKDVRITVTNYLEKKSDKNTQALILILSDGALDDYVEALKQQKIINASNVVFSSMYLESPISQDSEYYSWDEATGELDYSEKWSSKDVEENEKKTALRFKEFASSESLFVTSINPEEIRKHMIKSISTVSKID